MSAPISGHTKLRADELDGAALSPSPISPRQHCPYRPLPSPPDPCPDTSRLRAPATFDKEQAEGISPGALGSRRAGAVVFRKFSQRPREGPARRDTRASGGCGVPAELTAASAVGFPAGIFPTARTRLQIREPHRIMLLESDTDRAAFARRGSAEDCADLAVNLI